tara:strand:+ start:4681 stop:4920 length:240 start_codon:yes stop_codon:yes gene_type:complete
MAERLDAFDVGASVRDRVARVFTNDRVVIVVVVDDVDDARASASARGAVVVVAVIAPGESRCDASVGSRVLVYMSSSWS